MTTETFQGFDLSDLARGVAEQHLATITAYNAQAAEEDSKSGPSKLDMFKKASERTDDTTAKKLVDAYDKAKARAAEARKEVVKYGAELLGVEFEDTAEVSDEDREAAQAARKELIGVLRVAAMNASSKDWAESFEVPNVGREGSTTIGEGGTKRHRVDVVVTNGERTLNFASLSKLSVEAVKNDLPKFNVDKLRQAYEKNNEQPTSVETEGYTVTITKRED